MRMMKRFATTMALLLVAVLPVLAQGTVAPVAKQTFLDTNGNPLTNGRLYVYAAGTTTAATIYADSTLTTPALNAAVCACSNIDASGRFTFFLSQSSYRFTLKTSSDVLVWDVDNVSSVPPSNVNLDVDGTAGEALTAGDVVYLSAGDGSKTPGYWYKASSANTYSSSDATAVGLVPSSIASTAIGSIRLSGHVTTGSGVSPGVDYFISTAGALTSTAPTNRRLVGRADTTTTLVIAQGPKNAEVVATANTTLDIVCGRLSLTSGVPATTTDVTAATTLYYTLDGCDKIALFDGTATWNARTFAELSIAVPATTSQMYDVWVYDNGGTPALELLAWTNDTTRATALVRQNGRLVKTGATTRRYVGSFRTTTVSGQTEDSGFTCTTTKRYLWNYYHRVRRPLCRTEATATWTYTTATPRQANASTANQLDVVVGVSEVELVIALSAQANTGSVSVTAAVGIGEDSTTTFSTSTVGGSGRSSDAITNYDRPLTASFTKYPAVGRYFYAWLEWSTATGTTTWYGTPAVNGGPANTQNGLVGFIEG